MYFQYELHLQPCVNCVYERALFLTFILAGIIGALGPASRLFRLPAILIFLAGSVGGVMVALEHLNSTYQTGLGARCLLKADFPAWLPLDVWLPEMFAPTAACEKLDWSLLGFSMPEWILFTFACGVLVSACFLLSEFFSSRRRKSYYERYYR